MTTATTIAPRADNSGGGDLMNGISDLLDLLDLPRGGGLLIRSSHQG